VPALVVVVVMTCPVCLLVITTFEPLTTDPVGSVTVPTILPVLIVVWASTRTGDNKSAVTSASLLTRALRREKYDRSDIIHLPSIFRHFDVHREI